MAKIYIIRTGTGIVASKNIDIDTVMTERFFGQSQITSRIESQEVMDIAIGDYIKFDNKQWYINQQPNITKNASNNFVYEIIFESENYNYLKVQYLYFGAGEFYLTGDADAFIDLIITNMNRIYSLPAYSKGTVDQTDTTIKTLHFKDENCRQVIQRICTEFSGEIYFVGRQINFTDKYENATGVILEYRSGLRNISKFVESEKNIITRLYGYGANKNLGINYRSGKQRLEFDNAGNNYLENNVATFGVIEAVQTFEEIYPHRTGTVTTAEVGADVLVFDDSAMDFDVNSYLIDDVTAKVHFNTGDLAGYEFEIESYDAVNKRFTLIANKTAVGIDTLPNATLKPAIDDEYVIIDITMPASYITAAETELEAATLAYLTDNSVARVKYQVTADNHWFKEYGVRFKIGDTFTIYDDDLSMNVTVRITELSYPLYDPYQYTMVLSNFIDGSFIQRLYEDNKELKDDGDIDDSGNIPKSQRNWRTVEGLRAIIIAPDGYINIGLLTADNIQTGRIESENGLTYFDLDTNTLVIGSGAGTIAGTNITSIENGATAGATWGSNLGSIPLRFTDTLPPTGSGLCITSTYMGFYSNNAWKTYMDNAGNLVLGDIAGGNKGLSWNQGAGSLTVQGTVQTAASGVKRTVVSGANNNITLLDASDNELLKIDDNVFSSKPGILMDESGIGGIIYITDGTKNVCINPSSLSYFVGCPLYFGISPVVISISEAGGISLDGASISVTGGGHIATSGYCQAASFKIGTTEVINSSKAIVGVTGITVASGNITLSGANATVDTIDVSAHIHDASAGNGAKITYANLASIPTTFAPSAHAMTSHTSGTWKLFASNGTVVVEIANAAVGKFLTSQGVDELPAWKPSGAPSGGDQYVKYDPAAGGFYFANS